VRAIQVAKKLAAPYTVNQDDSLVTIRIALFTGDHFVIRKQYEPIQDIIDSKSK
jgi:hypothetical protein